MTKFLDLWDIRYNIYLILNHQHCSEIVKKRILIIHLFCFWILDFCSEFDEISSLKTWLKRNNITEYKIQQLYFVLSKFCTFVVLQKILSKLNK